MNPVSFKSSGQLYVFRNGVNLRESFLLLVLCHQLLFHARGIFLEVFWQAALDAENIDLDKTKFDHRKLQKIYSLNTSLLYVVSRLNLHLVGRQDFCSVCRNRVCSFQDGLLGLLVEHLQLLWVSGGQGSITNNAVKEDLLLCNAVLAVIELPFHEENFVLLYSILHQGPVVIQPIY